MQSRLSASSFSALGIVAERSVNGGSDDFQGCQQSPPAFLSALHARCNSKPKVLGVILNPRFCHLAHLAKEETYMVIIVGVGVFLASSGYSPGFYSPGAQHGPHHGQ